MAAVAASIALVLLIAGGAHASATTTLLVTGDVNLNPKLNPDELRDPTFIWGDMLNVLRAADVLAINHESTMAEMIDPSPDVIQFEDPLNYEDTFTKKGADVSFMSVANNHQFDYGVAGMYSSMLHMATSDIKYGGIGNSSDAVRAPALVTTTDGHTVAFFTMIIDECFVWPNGSLYLDGCTCGTNAGLVPYYQCYAANETMPGQWYHWLVTDEAIEDAVSVVSSYRQANPEQLVVVFLHLGPNFQWQPYASHEQMLRNISQAGADIVWATSSHHIQRFEFFGGKPIIYGLGDFLFRHVPGVDDFCPIYAVPCEQYRPELSMMYQFEIDWSSAQPKVSTNVTGYGTRHTPTQTFRVSAPEDWQWLVNTLNELSNPSGANVTYDSSAAEFRVSCTTC